MQRSEQDNIEAAIAALQGQRATLGDAVLEQALAPLRARLAQLQRPTEGLRLRQVTVLFADVVGSTALAGELDAEDTLELLSSTLRLVAGLIEAHGGRVLRFTGDGVKAAFGMDEAREDDAARALRAGLAILQAGREQAETARRDRGIADFALRVGVHTGDVALGAGVEADNTAMGAAVNIAARMEQSAPPGGLRISHDTWSHVRGLFDMQAQPPLQVKGVEAPMQTYLVRAALDRSVASHERGLQGLATPMIGRDAELLRLRQAVADARDQQRLQAVTLLGDAGLGKSRLLRELQAAVPDEPLLSVRLQADGQLRPWGVLRGLLATCFGVADTDSADDARRKVVEGLVPWFTEQAERRAQLIGQLAGLDFGDSVHLRGLDPRALRDLALGAIVAWLRALAARDGALLVLIEDLHWADEGSLDLLQHVCTHTEGLALALVMTARPALRAQRPDWGANHTLLALAPLGEDHSQQLMQRLLQPLGSVPPALAELVVGRAEGNPYYMEELVRRLIDDRVIEADGARWSLHEGRLQRLRLPGTLVGLLQARLDALPPGERLAARQASIVGHVFWDDALRALNAEAPQALPALQRAAFVQPHAQSDFEGTTEHQFHHHLLHQVTYDTLLKTERREGHGAAARWLAERTQGRGPEFLAMTGDHAERAGDTALAIDCFVQAGEEARKRSAYAAARNLLGRALALLGDASPLRRYAVLGQLESVADVVGERAEQEALHARMAALLQAHPDEPCRADLLWRRATLADRRMDGGVDVLAQQAFDVAAACGAAETAAMSQQLLAWDCHRRGRHQRSGEYVEEGLRWAARIDRASVRTVVEVRLMNVATAVLAGMGRFDAARDMALGIISRCRELGEPRLSMGAINQLTIQAFTRGRWDELADWAGQERALASAFDIPIALGSALRLLGRAAHQKGDYAAARGLFEESLAIYQRIGDRDAEWRTRLALGATQMELADLTAAAQNFEQAHTFYASRGDADRQAYGLGWAAVCALRAGADADAGVKAEAALALLQGPLANEAPHETIEIRWLVWKVLQALDDARAAPLLEALYADVQRRAVELGSEAEREQVVQALPHFREPVAAYALRQT